MKVRDRRFRTGRTYTVYGIKWTRHVNFAERSMLWKCNTHHPVRIRRDKFGRYFLSCRSHGSIMSTRVLARAFRVAAVHMLYLADDDE